MISLENIKSLLMQAVKNDASDIHLSKGYPPMVRIDGRLIPLKGKVLNQTDMEDIVVQILDDYQMDTFKKEFEIDFGYSIPDVAHFRVNLFNKMDGYGLAFRIIPDEIKSLEELGMPQGVIHLSKKMEGLILVTGPTGHGKSTTLAAMIELINTERRSHIVTVEDPIEYKYTPKNCLIQQRELGHHTHSFARALKSALREDPDVILLGEMRDLETISLALTAAETGHLVFSTLHTRNAPDTINRIIDVFPPEQQRQILSQIANSLIGIISQRLLIVASGNGRIAAVEVMIADSAIRNLIREKKAHQIRSIMQSSSEVGMQTMDDSLLDLMKRGVITRNVAMRHAIESERFLPQAPGKKKSRMK
ncbi:MAG: type IV pilus twitching motility protein PilT [bacterium]